MHRVVSVWAVVLAGLCSPALAHADSPGYTVPEAELAAALSCPSAFPSTHEPVLLVHGTAITAEEHWSWNYAKVLPTLGYDVCLVHLPDREMSDIQISSEYVVYAIRWIAAASGRRVEVIGHSQGTLEPRWAIRWWPDVRALVDDYVSLAGPHHGTDSADGLCSVGSCFPSAWQMRHGSAFLAALDSLDETPGEISYSSIYSQTDELVQPPDTAILEGASNVMIQDLCPLRPVHHLGLNEDAVVFALVMDALTHPGPVDSERVQMENPALCTELLMPGITPFDAAAGNADVYGNGLLTVLTHPQVGSEPPLAPYTSE